MPKDWDADIPVFPPDSKGMATRVASGKLLNAISKKLPSLIGGSADLDSSTKTALEAMGDFENRSDEAGTAGINWRRLELCGTQPALRCSRTCDGIHREWVGGVWRYHSIHGDIPHFLGLHAAADQAGRADGTGGGLRFHARYLDAYRSAWQPANLIQAQRDYFGSHTYERIDAKGTFHTEWEKA